MIVYVLSNKKKRQTKIGFTEDLGQLLKSIQQKDKNWSVLQQETYKSKKNGWNHTNISREEYYETYVNGAFEFGKELRYYIDDTLVCVDLIDILEDGISAIYCYYDPEYLHLSLGKYSLLYQIDLAKNLGLQWVYIGNWIEGYKDFEYKENFKPLEVLENFPRISEKAIWKPFKRKIKSSTSHS